MSPYSQLTEIRPGVRVIAQRTTTLPPARHTNCIFVGRSQLFVIDPAAVSEHEQQQFTERVDQMRGNGGVELSSVLLTHGHPDHIGSAKLLRDRYGIPIWAHAGTAGDVSFPIDRLLKDDEILRIPGDSAVKLRCLHTPGHHPGHLCFLEESSGTLIAGDMIAEGSSIVIAHGRGGDMSAYLDSLSRLMDLECELLLPSHGSALTNPEAALRKQFDHRMKREAKVQSALDSGARTIKQLLEASYDDVPTERLQLAEYSLKAHLVKLGFTKFDEIDGIS